MMENIISKFFSRIAVNRLISRSSYVLGISLPVGMTASYLYNKAYSFYYDLYKKEGYSSLLDAKRALLAELKKLDIKSWSLPEATKATSKANKNKNTRSPIDYKMMTFKKNFPSLFIFKDFIFKQDAKIENLVFIQKILTIVIKGTFIPLLILSFYIWIRRYFLWTSGIFTTSYVGLRFTGHNDYTDQISNIVVSIRDTIVKIITNIVGVFLNVDLVDRARVFAQVEAEAMAKMEQYDLTIRALERKLNSLPPIPKEVITSYSRPSDGVVFTAKTPVKNYLWEGDLLSKYHKLDPYIDQVSGFIYNHLPEVNVYTLGIGAVAVAGTVAYYYGTGGYDKPILSGIKGVFSFIGQAFLGLATMTESNSDSTTEEGSNNSQDPSNKLDNSSNKQDSVGPLGREGEEQINKDIKAKGKEKNNSGPLGTITESNPSSSSNLSTEETTAQSSRSSVRKNKDNSSWGYGDYSDNRANPNSSSVSTVSETTSNNQNSAAASGTNSNLTIPTDNTKQGLNAKPTGENQGLNRESLTSTSDNQTTPHNYNGLTKIVINPSNKTNPVILVTDENSPDSPDSSSTINAANENAKVQYSPTVEMASRVGSSMFPMRSPSTGERSSLDIINRPGLGNTSPNSLLNSITEKQANIHTTGLLGVSQSAPDSSYEELMQTPNRPNWESHIVPTESRPQDIISESPGPLRRENPIEYVRQDAEFVKNQSDSWLDAFGEHLKDDQTKELTEAQVKIVQEAKERAKNREDID